MIIFFVFSPISITAKYSEQKATINRVSNDGPKDTRGSGAPLVLILVMTPHCTRLQ